MESRRRETIYVHLKSSTLFQPNTREYNQTIPQLQSSIRVQKGFINEYTMYEFSLRWYCFQKLILVWIFSFINVNDYFITETVTFGYSDILTIYTFHTYHFMPQHTDFEHSAACLSVVFELLPGLIPFAILWDAGWTLEKDVYIKKHELQLSDYNIGKYFSPKCTNFW